MSSLATGGCLLSILSLLSLGKLSPFPFPFAHTTTFTPLGNFVDQAVYLAMLLPPVFFTAFPFFKGKTTPKTIGFFLGGIVICIGFLVSVYQFFFHNQMPVVLHADVHPPVPVEPGQPECVDYEYERKGTRNLFVMVEPLAGWRHVEVTAQRTMQDYAKIVRWLVDEVYPQASYICLVQDNLNAHTPAALYETFPPAEARRILLRLEFHYTPKHGSWLNMAEIEIAILERNALSRRLESEAALRRQVSAVETERNGHRRGISWQFTSRDARLKLERLYPVKEFASA